MNPSNKNSSNGASDKLPFSTRQPALVTSSRPIFMPKPANLQPAISDQDGLTPEQLAEVWARRADALAQKPPEEISGDTITLLVFWMGQEQYGVDVINVREIYPLEQLTPVPRTPDFVVGVFSARGRILSVIDLRAFYGLPVTLPVNAEAREGSQSKIIVVTNTDPTSDTADMEIGLLADEVTDVRVIFMDQLEPPLSVQTGGRANHIQGLTADMLVVLDLNALLNDKQLIVKDEL